MTKFWHVAWQEYRKSVFNKGFMLLSLAVPVVLLLIVGLTYLSNLTSHNYTAVGYVDHADMLGETPWLPPLRAGAQQRDGVAQAVSIVAYDTEAAARVALDGGEIQGYFVIPERYPAVHDVDLVYYQYPSGNAIDYFWDFLQLNLLRDQPQAVASRAVAGSNLIARTPNGLREHSEAVQFNTFLPIISGVAVILLLLTGAGTLVGAVSTEKENRTMEVLVTSLSPMQLLGGKITGIVAMSFTQLAIWLVSGAAVFFFAGQVLDIPTFQNIGFSPLNLGVTFLLLVPTYVLIGAFMMTLGVSVMDPQEANQVGPLIFLVLELPYMFTPVFIETPYSPIALFLSLFPPTALETVTLRMSFLTVPWWQIAASFLILCASALGMVWVAGKAFRLGMLRYGQKIQWRALFRRADTPLAEGS